MSLADQLCGPRRDVQTGEQKADAIQQRIAAVRTRGDLKRLLHDDGGLSLSEAAARVKGLMSELETKADEPAARAEPITTRAGRARAFRHAREEEEARIKVLREAVDGPAWGEAYELVPKMAPCPVDADFAAYTDQWKRTSDRQVDAQREIADRLLEELDGRIKACKNADEIEALLVREGWKDTQILQYLDRFVEET